MSSQTRQRRGIRPGYAVAERCAPTGERPSDRGLYLHATAGGIKRLGSPILVQHPEVEPAVCRAALGQPMGCCAEQSAAYAVPLKPVDHVQVVEECAPLRIRV